MERLSFAIIGSGALGGLYGAMLARAGCEVHFLLNSDYQHVVESGLKVESHWGDFDILKVQAHANAVTLPACDVTIVSLKDEASMRAGERLYAELRSRGIDVILDDRDARAGVKFADAELIGIPYRITIGPKALAEGEVEFTPRATGETTRIGIDAIVDQVAAAIVAAR